MAWLGVAVSDRGPQMPIRSWLAANYAWIKPSGRGLWIVEALSSR